MVISRRQFLRSGAVLGGGFFVAVTLPNLSIAQTITRTGTGAFGAGFKFSAYLEIRRDGDVILTIGKSEMGQGTLTGIAQLVADELACAWSQIKIVQAKAAADYGFPHNGFMITGGSSGLRTEWLRMRKMGAAARLMLLQTAADKWGLDRAILTVADGIISAPNGQQASFADLAEAASKQVVPEDPPLKAPEQRIFIGKAIQRLDTEQKILGTAEFGIDVQVPHMLTAIVITPPHLLAPLKRFDASEALVRPGVRAVVPISTGIAIVGDHYWAVHSARDAVQIEWQDSPFTGMDMDQLRSGYRDALATTGKVAEAKGDVDLASHARSVVLEMEQPYLAHACMEPMNFTVWVKDDSAEVWGPTQAQSLVQNTVARIAGIDPNNVTVHTTFLGGGFGRRSAQDFVQSATEIALATGQPLKLMYSREDDMRAGRYRPFSQTRAVATQDADGNFTSLDVKIAVPSVSKWSGLKFLIRDDGVDEQAVEGLVDLAYEIPNTHIEWVDHDPKIPVHFWRAVGSSHNPFVLESLIDELAFAAAEDPLTYRRKLLSKQPRYLSVLNVLEHESDWFETLADDKGRGMAIVKSFGTIVAEAVEVRLVDGVPVVDKVTCVVDCGVAVNPGQIEAQMHSSIVFGLSAFLRGEITLSNGAIMQSNFHDYQPLRIHEMPQISVHILEGDETPGGVGEPGLPPILPAVGNALYALTGKRLTRLPFVSLV